MTWIPIEGRPPATREVTLIWSVRRGRMLLLAVPEGSRGLDVWGLSERRWCREETGILPVDSRSRWHDSPLAWADPEGAVTVARLTPDGISLATLGDETSATFQMTLPEGGGRPSAAWDVSTGRAVLCAPLVDESRLFAVDRRAGKVEELPDGPRLDRITSGPKSVFGIGSCPAQGWRTALYEKDAADRWHEVGAPKRMPEGLTWYAPEATVAGFLSANDSMMRLHVWTETSFEARPEIEMPFINGGGLATSPRGQVVFFGGQDFDTGGGYCNETRANRSDGGGAPERLDGPVPPLGGQDTLLSAGEGLVVANHGSCAVLAFEDEQWRQVVEAIPRKAREQDRARFDHRFENFAAHGDELWMLDATGGLWHAHQGDDWSRLEVVGEDGPEGYYSRRVAMAWDPLGRRLVLQGGQKADGWAYVPEDNTWTELEGTKPKRGYGPAVSTPLGIFALIGRRLWHLAGDDWTPVGKKTIRGTALLFDAKRERLLVVGVSGVFAIGAKGEPLQLAEGPSQVTESTPIGVDPARDRIVIYGSLGSRCDALALTDLEVGTGLPSVNTAAPPRKKKVKVAAAEMGGGPVGAVRRFELVADGTAKFWEIALQRAEHTVRYGRVGAKGRSMTKSFADPNAADKDAERRIREKTKKGYVRVLAPEAAPIGSTAAEQLETLIDRLRTTTMEEDEPDLTALRWESQTYETLGEGAKERKKKLDGWEKRHLEIPADLREFVERWATPTVDGNIFGTPAKLRVDLGASDLLLSAKTSYTVREDESRLFVHGEPVTRWLAFDDKSYSSVAPLALGAGGAVSWVAFGQDMSTPDGVHFGPLAPSFGDAVIGMALGLTDAIFMGKGRSRTGLEKRIATELDDSIRTIALAWLDRYQAHAEALRDRDDCYHLDVELSREERPGMWVILVVPDEVPGAAAVAETVGRPELAKVPFVFCAEPPMVGEALASLPGDVEYDDAYRRAGDAVGKHLFEHLVGVGGCPTHYTYWPRASREQVRVELRKKSLEVRELVNHSTAPLYTLGVGARAALKRVAALRRRLREA